MNWPRPVGRGARGVRNCASRRRYPSAPCRLDESQHFCHIAHSGVGLGPQPGKVAGREPGRSVLRQHHHREPGGPGARQFVDPSFVGIGTDLSVVVQALNGARYGE